MPTSLTTGEREGLRHRNRNASSLLTRPELIALLDMADEAARLRTAIEAHRLAWYPTTQPEKITADARLYAALETP